MVDREKVKNNINKMDESIRSLEGLKDVLVDLQELEHKRNEDYVADPKTDMFISVLKNAVETLDKCEEEFSFIFFDVYREEEQNKE